jgi:predicted RNA-binding protein with PIN domain
VGGDVLYLFDGHNLLHAGAFRDEGELVDRLASYLGFVGARGVVVFDGVGETSVRGALEVRYAAHADDVVERLAADHRGGGEVVVVSSDRAIAATAGQEVAHRSARVFLRELEAAASAPAGADPAGASRIEDSLDEETRARLERWRRGH